MTVPKHAATPTRETYDGKELRPIVGRPGAMDAYQLPSMVSGVRVPRKTPIINAGDRK